MSRPTSDRRRSQWRKAQARRATRLQSRDMKLLRVLVTESEAIELKCRLQELRHAARLRMLRAMSRKTTDEASSNYQHM